MSKRNLLRIITIMTMLCLLMGAWLILSEREPRHDTANDVGAVLEKQIAKTAINLKELYSETGSEWKLSEHVYSHRGSAGPNEHSFEAYDAAIEAGSHNIEQDIVISKDGTLYISHDLTAAAMTGDGRAYSDMTDAEIDSLTRYSGGRILKLSEVLERYGRKVHYIIELKSGDSATIEAFRKEIDSHGAADLVVVQSGEISVLEELESIYPDMPKLLVVKTSSALQQAMDSDVVDIVGARKQFVNASNCREAHERGKKFAGWTLDSEEEIINAIDADADAYFTNDTAMALRLEQMYRYGKSGSLDHFTIFFASDYQAEEGFDAPRDTLSALLDAIAADGKAPDMAVLCGDYTNEAGLYDHQISPDAAIDEVRGLFLDKAQLISRYILFTQGNHDKLTDELAGSGLHEYENCLVYVVNTENDFPWKQGKVSGAHDKVAAAAEKMKHCFDDLIANGESRPVFIAGHVPLHYTARTSSRHTTGDNLYSSLIFDVVNEAAKKLDVVYLFGHNHSKGWDCYLGGACVYKAAGDTLLLPVFSDSDVNTDIFEEKTLNFTYMNAGYTGYYMNCASEEYRSDYSQKYAAADETLTATICEIFEDRIEITRYDANGKHILGAAGEADPYKSGIDTDLIDSKYYSRGVEGPAVIYRMNRGAEILRGAA